ncbi:polysaccharide deacetylase family protein [Aquabacterium sp.]|uniref:polysaccharide deacetylase family protein n=1 Tax=Aquabacterium sp. TaxID=1872578 RepID=UPI0035B4DCE9
MHPWFRNASKDFFQHVWLRGGFIWRLPANERTLALTFDDGPDPVHTPATLDLLARLKVKATFFLIGRNAEQYPDLVRRIVQEGHAIGGHTFEHVVITQQSESQLADDLQRCRVLMRQLSGVDSTLFRPPKGEVNVAAIRRVCRLGYQLVHWSKTYSDYQQDGADALCARIERDPAQPGDIVLFHDNNPHTVEALARAIPAWQSAGFSFRVL